MTSTLEDIKRSAMNLSTADRIELATWLWDGCSDDSIDESWLDQADDRLGEFERGEVKGIPASEALARLRASNSGP